MMNPFKNKSGMTLMEVMIVMLIIGGSATLFFSKIKNTNSKIKEAVRQFGVLTRDLHNRAKLQNKTFRLVLDLKEGETNKGDHSYWVESASGSRLSNKESLSSPYDKKKKSDKDNSPSDPSDFERDDRFGKSAKSLPSGVYFEDVEVRQLEDPVTSGRVFIHFRPEGFVDESIIHLKYNKNLRWSISIHPLTGKSYITSEYITLDDLNE